MNAAIAASSTAQPPVAQASRGHDSLSNVAGLWALYLLSVRQYMHGKRWLIASCLFLLPAALAVLFRCTRSNIPNGAVEFLLVFMFIPQAILPLMTLLNASGMIQDELEGQTITYLLIRPLPKWAIYIVKLLATVTVVALLTAVFTIVTYAAIYVGASSSSAENIPLRCVKAVCVHCLAGTTYCCMFGLLSLLTKRSLVVGILYIAVVEGVLANLPFGIRLTTVIYYSRLIAYRTLTFVEPTPRGTENIAADAWQLNVVKDPNLLEHPQLSTCVMILLISCLIFSALAVWLFSKKEFHVKTPENS